MIEYSLVRKGVSTLSQHAPYADNDHNVVSFIYSSGFTCQNHILFSFRYSIFLLLSIFFDLFF